MPEVIRGNNGLGAPLLVDKLPRDRIQAQHAIELALTKRSRNSGEKCVGSGGGR